MQKSLFLLTVLLLICCSSLQSQVESQFTRLEKQQFPSQFLKMHFQQAEESIIQALDTNWVGDQVAAIQTLRDLEQMFSGYPFAATIKPLTIILKRSKSDPQARYLAALALDELRSDAGDAALKDVAISCDDRGLQTLCQALLGATDRERQFDPHK